VRSWELRAAFAAQMATVYGHEVPAYTTLVEVASEVNSLVAALEGESAERLGSISRVTAERHGAIRVGTPTELRQVATIFAALGMHPVGFYDLRDAALLNGVAELPPVAWHVGQRQRLRLIGIAPVATARVRLMREQIPIAWRALAKDGADLPTALATPGIADLAISPGETYDFEVVPDAPGILRLEAEMSGSAGARAGQTINVLP